MATKKGAGNIPQDTLDLYEKLVATSPGIGRKGATVPYTSLNGNMFSFINKEGSLGIRLPAESREPFLKKYRTTLVTAYGMVMKEYVAVPEDLLKNTKELAPYFRMSVEYVKSLKPKPTTGRKHAGKKK